MSSAAATDWKPGADPPPHLSWEQRREWFRARLKERSPPEITAEEIEGHLAGMPRHYWERVTESDLVWGLQAIHGFLKLVTSPQVPPTTPFVSWRPAEERPYTRLLLCTWDRQGLLAKAAAAFSAVRLSILRADVFTRTDNVVLDEFYIVDADGRGAATEARLQEMTFLLEGALSDPPRFAAVWACSRHKFLAAPDSVAPRITFDNDTSAHSTLVRITAADRLGLLYDILQAIADAGLDIRQARIETESELAHDIVYVTDDRGQKLLDPRQLASLRTKLQAALTRSD
jgi:[protein-PII] uridylyltransferase